MFVIPGFGGTHSMGADGTTGRRRATIGASSSCGSRSIRPVRCGHHVFADSANNGPVGRALIEEFIPAFDRQYRSIADPRARFLNGHSSGGWSSLWLQVTYPDSFGGVWSTAPDSVDFRDFQRIDLYEPGVNMYVDEQGTGDRSRCDGDRVLLWYDDFAWMEHVLGYGGQLHSFEAVFSPRGDDGRPLLLFDRETGEVDPAVARSWERTTSGWCWSATGTRSARNWRGRFTFSWGRPTRFCWTERRGCWPSRCNSWTAMRSSRSCRSQSPHPDDGRTSPANPS